MQDEQKLTAPEQARGTVNNPLGTERISRLILRFGLPSVISMVVNALYNMVDQIFIGNGVGYLGNAATNVILPFTVIFLGLGLLIGDGCSAYFALSLGRNQPELARDSVGTSLTMGVLVSAGLSLLAFAFLEPLCLLFGASENVLPYALDYGRIIVLGMPTMAISVILSGAIRSDGHPRYAMLGLLLGCGINLVLDPLFVLVFHWGVTGAAVATVLGQTINATLCLFYLRRFQSVKMNRACFRPRLRVLGKVCALGVSSLITQVSIVVVIVLSNNQFVRYGAQSIYGPDIPLAAHGVTMKINQILNALIIGLSVGAAPILGFNFGAGKLERVKQTYRVMLLISLAIGCTGFIVFQCCPMAVISIFGSESELYNQFAVKCMRTFLLLCCVNGVQMCTGVFFQATGHPLPAAILSTSRQILLFVPAVLILPAYLGVEGVLWVGPVADGGALALAIVLLLTQWRRIFSPYAGKNSAV